MAEMKIIGKTRGEKITDVIIYLLMIALCIICVYPLLFTVFAAFSDAKKLMNRTVNTSQLVLKKLSCQHLQKMLHQCSYTV